MAGAPARAPSRGGVRAAGGTASEQAVLLQQHQQAGAQVGAARLAQQQVPAGRVEPGGRPGSRSTRSSSGIAVMRPPAPGARTAAMASSSLL
jgi:hypothetical protein